MNVSIEISTFNRKETLRELLMSLVDQTYPADLFEVVLSDDGSTDGLTEMVASMMPDLPFRLRMLRHEHKGPANAHNRGIEAADSDIVIMLAADVLASPYLVEQHVKSHEEYPSPNIMISGRLVQSSGMPDTVFQRNWDRMLNRMFEEEKLYLRHGFFFVSNLSFKKAFMLSQGMFLEWPPASMEDLELGHRLKRNGMSLVRNTQALGHHYHPVSPQSVANRAYSEGYYWHQFEEHVPETWVRAKSGHIRPSDGWLRYLQNSFKHAIKRVVINDFTIPLFIVPMIKGAEQWRFLSPGMRLFTLMLSIYYYEKGKQDYDRGGTFNAVHTSL